MTQQELKWRTASGVPAMAPARNNDVIACVANIYDSGCQVRMVDHFLWFSFCNDLFTYCHASYGLRHLILDLNDI